MSTLSLQIVPSTEEKLGLPIVYQVICQTSKELANKLEQLSVFHVVKRVVKADEHLSTPIAQDTTLATTSPVAILYDLSLGLLQLQELIRSTPNIPVICIVSSLRTQDSLLEELFSLGISDYIELDEVSDTSLKKTIQKAQYRNTASISTTNNTIQTQIEQQNSKQARADNISPEKQTLLDESLFRAELNLLINDVLSKGQGEDIYQTMLEKAVDIIPGAQAGSMALKIDNGYKFVAAVGFDLDILSSILFDINDFKLPNWTKPKIANYYDDAWDTMSANKRDVLKRSASDQQIKSALSIPILKGDEVIVIFNLDNFDSKDAFNDSATGMAQMFATQIGALQQRISLEENLRNEQKRLSDESSFRAELNALMSDVLSQSSNEKTYQTILEKAVNIIPSAQAGSMAVLTDEGYHFVAAVGFDLDLLASAYFNLQDLRPSSIEAELSTHNYFDDDWYRMEDYKREIFKTCGPSADIKTSISIPILDGETIVVIFNLDNFESEDAFDETSRSMAQVFSTQIEALWQRINLENNLFKEQKRLQNESSFRAELNSLMSDVLSQDDSEQVYQVMLEKAVDIIPHVHAGSMAILTDNGYQFVAAVEFNLNAFANMTFNIEDFGHDATWSQPTIKNYFDDEWHKLSTEKQEAFVNASTGKTVESSLTIPIMNKGNIVILFNLDNFDSKNAFDDTTISMGQMFARQIEAIWQRFELEKNVKANEQRYKKLFIDADRSNKELEILDKLQHAISSKLELEELYTTVVKTIVKVFDFSGVTIGLVKGDTIVRGPTNDLNIKNDPAVRKLDNSIAGRIVETKKPELINNLSVHPDVRPEHGSKQLSMIAIPFCAEQEVLGILYITHNQRTLTQNDLVLMQKVVDQLELAIENAQLHKRVRTDLARTQALHKISEATHRANNLQDFTQQIIDITRKAISARWAVVYKLDWKYEKIEHIATSQDDQKPAKLYTFEELKNGVTGWAIKNQEIVCLNKNMIDEREHPELKHERFNNNYGSIIVAPLIYQNEVLGSFGLVNHINDNEFTDDDIQVVQQVSNQASLALAQHKLLQKIEYQAFHDVVTALPNRFLFEDRLKQTIAHSKRYNNSFAVLFLDLDGFKHVNDTLGHDVGDLLLKQVAQRFKEIIRESDTLARMGGDEFAIILDKLQTNQDALRLAQHYQSTLEKPFEIDGNSLFISGSIGVSVYPEDGQDISTLLKHSDAAMYEAKATGKNRVQVFNQILAERSKERLELETKLRSAIEKNSFKLVYQPKIDLENGQCTGVEALIRWIDPELGFISPEKFIPIAEETGLITELGNWIIDEACRQTTAWHKEGFPITTAINIASVQFEHLYFVRNLEKTLEHHKLAPEFIELELTESMIMNDVEIVIRRLQKLRQLGVSIAIDDFGTGYSSLSYLQKLPLDCLKIDRSFVDLMDKYDHQKNLVQTIISLANNFDLKVVAEGVETEAQLELLKEMGCQTAQGYYFDKPLSVEEFNAKLIANSK